MLSRTRRASRCFFNFKNKNVFRGCMLQGLYIIYVGLVGFGGTHKGLFVVISSNHEVTCS